MTESYRILSLDGGGIRGVVTAILLERLLKSRPTLLDEVDLIAGTSTGGILALGLAKGLSPTELRALYEARGTTIFDDSIWDDIVDLGRLKGAEYSSRGLKKELIAVLGKKTRLKGLGKRVLVTAFDLDNEAKQAEKRSWKPKVFHNFPGPDSDGNRLAYEVGLYTSAAPTYFPSVDGYIDGGVFANNPAMVALSQTQDRRTHKTKPAFQDIRLLSLGTGTALTYIKGKRHDWGFAQWVQPLIQLMLDGNMGIADYQCRMILDRSYHRLAPTFAPNKSFDMDDTCKIPDLVDFAEAVKLTQTTTWLKTVW